MNNERLIELQKVELEVFIAIDKFCRENGINYSLYAGSALGAVRHSGFIPWDDDIDICMERNEYNRFLQLWRQNPVDGYTLSGDDEPGCHLNHTKIFKDNTILSNDDNSEVTGPHGVFVDIFPFDKVPLDKKKFKKFILKAKMRLIYTRDYPYKGGGKILEIVSRIILLKSKKYKTKKKRKLNEYVQQYKDMQDNYLYMGLERPLTLRFTYPADLFDTTEIEFENKKFLITKQSDVMLSTMYGDYMQLPPEEERVCKHNPEIIYTDNRGNE